MKTLYWVAGGVVVSAAGLAALVLTKKNEPETQSLPPPASTTVTHPAVEPIGIFKSISDGAMSLMTEPRGIRNNNPTNIRWNSLNNWNGQTGKDDKGFAIFDKPENGIRAAGKNLDSYARRGVVTVKSIIETWAPPNENIVEAYIKHVEQLTGWPRTKTVSRAAGDFVPLIAAMIRHENGKQPYSTEFIRGALNLP